MTALRIRPATREDVAAVHRIECASFGDPWSVASFTGLIGEPRVHFRVAVRGGEVVGYCVAWIVAEEGELANLAVEAGDRRAGVGAALLDDLLTTVDGAQVTQLFLEVREGNVAAQALYTSRGFTIRGRRKGYYRGPDEDAIVMWRQAGGAGSKASERA